MQSLAASASLKQFWLSRQWIQRADVIANAEWPRWQATATLQNQREQVLTVRGSGTGVDQTAVQAQADEWTLSTLQRGELTPADERRIREHQSWYREGGQNWLVRTDITVFADALGQAPR